MTRAPALRPGDTVGIVSPSWGGAAHFPHRVERGARALESLGFQVRFGRHARNSHGFVSDSPAHRASDLHEMFLDPAVRLVVSTIGGDHSCHLLPLLDYALIRENPTLLMGYSDVTVLNVAIWQQTGLVTLNGPALLTDFAEYPAMFDYTRDSFLRVACEARPPGAMEPSSWWTEEFLDWSERQDEARPRSRQPSCGWSWLKGGAAEGVLVGGCLESLQHLRGTRFWPDWEGSILFFETSELAPTPAQVDGILMDYDNMGVLGRIRGLLVGRPMRYTEQKKQDLRAVILERTSAYTFPVVTDMDFGHTAPQVTLPIGCRARIDVPRQRFELLEAAVADRGPSA